MSETVPQANTVNIAQGESTGLVATAGQDLPTPEAPPLSVSSAIPPLPSPPDAPTKRRGKWRRRIVTGLSTGLIVAMIFTCGGIFGYTQGPGIATLVSSGQQFTELGTRFQPCFIGFQRDTGTQNVLRALFGGRNRPTATPGPRPTADPTIIRVVKGTLVELTARSVTVQTATGQQETYPLFPFLQLVSDTGNRITQQGVLKGDSIDVLAFRANALGPLSASIGGNNPTPLAGATPSPDGYTALCIIVDVTPKKATP